MANARMMNLLIHTHRCEKLPLEVSESMPIMDLKARVEQLVGEGNLFRITGRSSNPGADDEYKLIFHGQVLEDFDSLAASNRIRLEGLRKKLAAKESERKALESERKQAKESTEASDAADARALELQRNTLANLQQSQSDTRRQEQDLASLVANTETAREARRERLVGLDKKMAGAKKEEKDLEKLVKHLEPTCGPQKLSSYYTGDGCMLHIVAAKAKPGQFMVRINYIGSTMQTNHCRCEHVRSILQAIRAEHGRQLPNSSEDFKIRDALYWRCAPTKMVRLDADKCLCEYGIENGSEFEHDIEKVPVSKHAQRQFASTRGKSRVKSMIAGRTPKRSMSSAGLRRDSDAGDQSRGSTPRRGANASRITPSRGSRDSPLSLDSHNLAELERRPSSSAGWSARSSARSLSSVASTLAPASESLPADEFSSASECANETSSPSRASRRSRSASTLRRTAFAEAATDSQSSAPCRPSRELPELPPVPAADEVAVLKNRERIAQKEMRQALKIAAKAEKALKETERKLQRAEAHAGRAQAEARGGNDGQVEVDVARKAQHAAEAALRANTKATFTALARAQAQNRTVLPAIERRAEAVPECVLCMDAPAEVMAYPCGHRCYCESCAKAARDEFAERQTARGDKHMTRCPVCREPLENLVRVF